VNDEKEDEAVPYTLLYRCPAPNSISEIKKNVRLQCFNNTVR